MNENIMWQVNEHTCCNNKNKQIIIIYWSLFDSYVLLHHLNISHSDISYTFVWHGSKTDCKYKLYYIFIWQPNVFIYIDYCSIPMVITNLYHLIHQHIHIISNDNILKIYIYLYQRLKINQMMSILIHI